MEAQIQIDTHLNIDFKTIRNSMDVLRAIHHKLRYEILNLIHQEKTMTVTHIYARLRLEQSVASQHLTVLRKSGVVKTVRNGKFIFYSINYDRLHEIIGLSKELTNGKMPLTFAPNN
ncbi:MAG: hypothetical protein RJA25_2002 [Bacteroidota bacterium]|jgi:DNA-binding transcriptional ArsR family regulator